MMRPPVFLHNPHTAIIWKSRLGSGFDC